MQEFIDPYAIILTSGFTEHQRLIMTIPIIRRERNNEATVAVEAAVEKRITINCIKC